MYRIYPFIYPPAIDYCEKPPTLYSIMESIANYDNQDPVKIMDLAEATHEKIFNFSYPLTDLISRKDFECMILDHFIERRIGRETMTAFKIALKTKLNSIMPIYNKMFEMLEGWDLFRDGEVVSEVSENQLSNETNSNTTDDRRYSDTPQNRIDDIKDGSYVTDYNFDTQIGNISATSNGHDNRTITRSPSDKIKIYKDFIENRTSIYEMIFRELDPLFYGLE